MSSATQTTAGDGSKDTIDYRLPTNVRPTHYDLTFKTDLEGEKFWGYGIIDLKILKDTSSITFNATAIDLTEASVTTLSSSPSSRSIQIAREVDTKQERVQLTFSETFKKDTNVRLELGWSAPLGGSMTGYYLSKFEKDGAKKNYALTQFEPTAARRAFPSWDEPLLKSQYTITLISRPDSVSLSNMPVAAEHPFSPSSSSSASENDKISPGAQKLAALFPASEKNDTESAKGEWKVTTFDKTPLMSSYLVAFANGEFEYLEDSYTSPLSGTKRKLRIYATPDVIHQAQFGLDLKRDSLPIYEKVFDVEYPLPKLDTLVAADFDAGAMENWGLITGRTTAFLYDPKQSSLAAKKRVATVQLHECAHMWFGDVVTMKWWDALWLNEGFATLMGEVIIMHKLFPDWEPHSSFISDHLERALILDAQRSSHPIQVDCPDANQINQFDALSYSKAASMLRMLSEYVGEEKFLKGVSIYLKAHLYGNSDPIDLWNGIAESTGLDIAKMMNNWTWKIGYPVLTVKEEGGKVHVRQDRFLASGDATQDENQTLWYIPLSVLSTDASGKSSIDRSVIIEEREKTLDIDTSKPFKLNAGTSGVYRVAYTPERLKQLGQWAAQENSVFSLEDRMGLVSDAIVLAKAGVGKTSAAFDLIESFQSEKQHLVWESINQNLASVTNILWEQPEEVRDQFKSFQRYLFAPLVKNLGWEYSSSDSAAVRQLRTLAITRSALAREPSVIEKLKSSFAKYQETGDLSVISTDIQSITFRIAVLEGGDKEYESVKAIWKKPPTPSAKSGALLALGQTKDLKLAERTLQLLVEEVPLQDWATVFVSLGTNTYTRRLLTKHFQDNYEDILKRYEGNFSLSYLIKYAHENYTTEKDAKDIEAWFKGKDVSKFNLALHQSLDAVRANAAWLERSKTDIIEWLAEFEKRISSARL